MFGSSNLKMSLRAGGRRITQARCLLDLVLLQSTRSQTGSAVSSSHARTSSALDARNAPGSRKQQIRPVRPRASAATSEDQTEEDDQLVPAEPAPENLTEFRGVMARAGIYLPLGIGNNFKPDPLLRHQITTQNQDEVLVATMTPLVHLNYEDQLRFKYERNKNLLRNISRTLERKTQIDLDENGLVCPLDFTVPSPVQSNFRNKDELNVAVGVDGYPNRVGYTVGRSRDNQNVCVSPDVLVNMKDSHKLLGRRFEEYVEASPYSGCRLEPHGFVGHWKGITARSNRKGDLMAIVIFHPQDLPPEEISAVMENLKDFFQNREGKDCNLKSLYFQACPHSQCSPLKYPYELLFGQEHIVETINNMSYRISPGAFFQLNTEAAEVMYKKIEELIRPNPETILLDVCCGTGTIGLSMASKVDQLIGVEKYLLAVADAEANMGMNNVQNATFYCDTAEKGIPRILKNKQYNYSSVSAIMNPGRGGLDLGVITALRQAPQVERVVYVSCLPVGNAMRNILDLCLPTTRNIPGEAFYPTRAIPCDMFPNTDHCELLILFERNRLFFT